MERLGPEGGAVVVDDPDGSPWQSRAAAGDSCCPRPHTSWVNVITSLSSSASSTARIETRFGWVAALGFWLSTSICPAVGRRPDDAVVAFGLVIVVGTLRSIGVQEAPPSVSGWLPGQPQAVAAALPFYDLHDLMRHRHRPLPSKDGGLVLILILAWNGGTPTPASSNHNGMATAARRFPGDRRQAGAGACRPALSPSGRKATPYRSRRCALRSRALMERGITACAIAALRREK